MPALALAEVGVLKQPLILGYLLGAVLSPHHMPGKAGRSNCRRSKTAELRQVVCLWAPTLAWTWFTVMTTSATQLPSNSTKPSAGRDSNLLQLLPSSPKPETPKP